MQLRTIRIAVVLVTIGALTLVCPAQPTSIDGADLALRSGGQATQKGWTLNSNGFVGTYVQLDKPAEIVVKVDASAPGAIDAVVNDTSVPLKDELRFQLPAGTHFIRLQHANHAAGSDVTIRSVKITGAAVKNQHTDANALAAADTYIANGRRGAATVKFEGVAPGTQVRAKLKRHSFMFGAAVGGYGPKQYFDPSAAPDSDAARYQAALRRHFQAIVPGNAGKWSSNEENRDAAPTMNYIDFLRDYAKQRGIPMRMHTLLWNTGQQPKYVMDLVDAASKGDAAAKAELRRAISKRIEYYVRDRATSYAEMDILNESLHQPKYWQIFGVEGIADIYREAARAVADAGASTRLCVNEYNVLQYSSRPPFGKGAEPDPYVNWYREHVEQIRAAGGPVGGIGVQYYAFTEPDIPSPHSAARIFGAFQNLSVTGLPVILSEFGVKTKSDPKRVPGILEDTMRITFGTPQATGFFMWGFWHKDLWDQAKGAAFYDDDWSPTAACKRWDESMAKWTTDEALTVGPDGAIAFTGYFGSYDLEVNGKTLPLTLTKGQTHYTVSLP